MKVTRKYLSRRKNHARLLQIAWSDIRCVKILHLRDIQQTAKKCKKDDKKKNDEGNIKVESFKNYHILLFFLFNRVPFSMRGFFDLELKISESRVQDGKAAVGYSCITAPFKRYSVGDSEITGSRASISQCY